MPRSRITVPRVSAWSCSPTTKEVRTIFCSGLILQCMKQRRPDAIQFGFTIGQLDVRVPGGVDQQRKIGAVSKLAPSASVRQHIDTDGKPAVILACVDAALADDKLLLAELELLRMIGMVIDCPMPPALETHAIA